MNNNRRFTASDNRNTGSEGRNAEFRRRTPEADSRSTEFRRRTPEADSRSTEFRRRTLEAENRNADFRRRTLEAENRNADFRRRMSGTGEKEINKLISDEDAKDLTRSFRSFKTDRDDQPSQRNRPDVGNRPSSINRSSGDDGARKSNEPSERKSRFSAHSQDDHSQPAARPVTESNEGRGDSAVSRSRFNARSGGGQSNAQSGHRQPPAQSHKKPAPARERENKPAVHETKANELKADPYIYWKLAALVLSVVLMMWLLPSGNVMNLQSVSLSTKDRATFFQTASENLLIDVLGNVHEIPRTYVLELSDTPTPVPDQSKYAKIMDEDRKNFDGSPIDYYKDATIEVKCWKEKTKYGIVTYAEVWIAHPSQFRRVIVDNVISKKHKDFPENIFRKTNGVLGMSGDYCAFRPYGIEIQYGKVIRDKVGSHLTPKMDILVYDINGNFSIYESTKDFFNTDVFKNGEIIHTFAFGPMLIDDYKVSTRKDKLYSYQNGSPGKAFPRAAVCQFDYDKHYLLCRIGEKGCNLETFAKEIQKKGVRLAYALDGGQTGTIMFNKEVVNEPAYTGTREMSDIFYFATAVPND